MTELSQMRMKIVHMFFRSSLVIVKGACATTQKFMRCFMRSMNILNESVHRVPLMSYRNACRLLMRVWMRWIHRLESRDYALPNVWNYASVSDAFKCSISKIKRDFFECEVSFIYKNSLSYLQFFNRSCCILIFFLNISRFVAIE